MLRAFREFALWACLVSVLAGCTVPSGSRAPLHKGERVDMRSAPAATPVHGAGPADFLWSLAPGTVFRDCDGCPEMVVIPAGSFTMGSPASEEGRIDAEGPQAQVTLSRKFAAGRFEVTRGEFARFVAESGYAAGGGCFIVNARKGWDFDESKDWRNPGFSQTERDPVTCVNWHDARAYARWLAEKTGKTYRLLTEAEWEYAARAGTTTSFSTGPAIHPTQANYDATYSYAGSVKGPWRRQTVPVGSFQPNAFGLYDVHGNVWEWTEDCWNESYYAAPGDGSARTSGSCTPRVLRGGAWNFVPQYLRSASRGWSSGFGRLNFIGFRVARRD
jgi:formylglycine-generating enzyme required for sulfatase activity